MDRLAALICVAQLKLRLEIITRYPELLEQIMADAKRPPLKIPMPVELAGMRSRLLRAQQQEKDITRTGQAYDDVLDRIDELHEAQKGHVDGLNALESNLRSTIMRMTERPNYPSDGDSDGRQSSSGLDGQGGETSPKSDVQAEQGSSQGTDIGEKQTITADEVGSFDRVTVNGVLKS